MLSLTQHNIVHPQVILIFVFMFAAGVAVVGFPWVLMGELATSNNLKAFRFFHPLENFHFSCTIIIFASSSGKYP